MADILIIQCMCCDQIAVCCTGRRSLGSHVVRPADTDRKSWPMGMELARLQGRCPSEEAYNSLAELVTTNNDRFFLQFHYQALPLDAVI